VGSNPAGRATSGIEEEHGMKILLVGDHAIGIDAK
jgi:hypothetical protein